jgi:hypothetical protein
VQRADARVDLDELQELLDDVHSRCEHGILAMLLTRPGSQA